MRNRPLSIKLLALAFILSPVGVVAEILWLYRVHPEHWYYIFLTPELWTAQVWAMLILTPLVGVAVWTTRKWGYYALVVYTGLIVVNNIAVWASGFALSGLIERAILTVGLAVLVFVELRKQFMAPYFNPRLRWWAQARRYLTDRFHIVVKDRGSGAPLFQADSFDVSETGIYLTTDHAAKIGEDYQLDVMLPGDRHVPAVGEVVWVHGGSDSNPPGFGCRFKGLRAPQRRAIRHAVRDLRASMQR
jgi:Tfp pilus assembly protein PilZ